MGIWKQQQWCGPCVCIMSAHWYLVYAEFLVSPGWLAVRFWSGLLPGVWQYAERSFSPPLSGPSVHKTSEAKMRGKEGSTSRSGKTDCVINILIWSIRVTEAVGWYLVSVHESYVLQTGLGCFLLWHQHSQQSLLLLHLTFQPLDLPVHCLQAVSQLGQLLFLELHDGQPEGA